MPQPQIVVPGNHDVPLHNAAARFLHPLRGFRRYIADDLHPFYGDGEIAVLGVNTARSLTIKRGRINEAQLAWMTERLCAYRSVVVRLVVTRYNIAGHSALLVQSGTAASDRGRGEENSFNVLRIDGAGIAVERFEWQPGRGLFEQVASERYRHTPSGWI